MHEVEFAVVLGCGATLMFQLILQTIRRNSPREVLEVAYNSLIDTRNAIAIRQSLILADIGACLQQLLGKLDAYDCGDATKSSVDNEIKHLEHENWERKLAINFYGLESHRSACSCYGPSFLQEHTLLFLKLQPFLPPRAPFEAAAHAFLKDPSLLLDRRLSHFFSS